MSSISVLPTAVTGDRPTGPLHLGHYVGSLRNRVVLQSSHRLTVLVADLQALTDNAGRPHRIAPFVPELMKDYLAVGLDPARTRFVLQSAVPELAELTVLLMNLATVGQLERNPTVRAEMVQRGFGREVPAGFLCYPVSQAADILGLGGGVVPVGEDQLPMVEMANLLSDRVNRMGDGVPLPRCEALLSHAPRLPGILGDGKMGKSSGNAIPLSADSDALAAAVRRMYTDPGHLKVSDPGQVEGNVVFAFLDAFDPEATEVERLKEQYRSGGLGDAALKRRLLGVMEAELAPSATSGARWRAPTVTCCACWRKAAQRPVRNACRVCEPYVSGWEWCRSHRFFESPQVNGRSLCRGEAEVQWSSSRGNTHMRTLLTMAMVFWALTASFSVAGATPTDEPVRLIRYSYAAEWQGATGVWAPAGKVGFMLQSDLQVDQQVFHLVSLDGAQMAKVVEQGKVSFVAPTGQEMAVTFDLALGTAAFGVPLGLATVVDWAQGHDGRGPIEAARIERGEDGAPTLLEENGWTVRYDKWTVAQGLAVPVPQRWQIEHESGVVIDLVLMQAEAFSAKALPEGYRPITVM